MRACPKCGNHCLFSRAAGLESEDEEMKILSKRLSSISREDNKETLMEAKTIISKLRQMNLRWNISSLDNFLKLKYRELFFQ